MRERPSNIPSKFLALRSRLASALDLPEDALPFVGELLQVKKEEARWQGAIERVLHNFSLSILVADEHYEALSNHVDAETLGERLVYFRVKKPVKDLPDAFRPGTIPTKLELASGPWRACSRRSSTSASPTSAPTPWRISAASRRPSPCAVR